MCSNCHASIDDAYEHWDQMAGFYDCFGPNGDGKPPKPPEHEGPTYRSLKLAAAAPHPGGRLQPGDILTAEQALDQLTICGLCAAVVPNIGDYIPNHTAWHRKHGLGRDERGSNTTAGSSLVKAARLLFSIDPDAEWWRQILNSVGVHERLWPVGAYEPVKAE